MEQHRDGVSHRVTTGKALHGLRIFRYNYLFTSPGQRIQTEGLNGINEGKALTDTVPGGS